MRSFMNCVCYFFLMLPLHANYDIEDKYEAYRLFDLTALGNLEIQEQVVFDHVKHSIGNAEQGNSTLPPEILRLEGLSSEKVRHLVNNLCSLPNTNYLEVGVWKGAVWVSALYQNQATVNSAFAVDNWSQFDGEKQFEKNCQRFLTANEGTYQLISSNCFELDKSVFTNPINVFFYDADSSEQAVEMAFTYFNNIFDDVFIAIVDDWNWEHVRNGTRSAFDKLGYSVLFEQELPARFNGDTELWWNGLYVAVIRKN